jgi:hypothetical protein
MNTIYFLIALSLVGSALACSQKSCDSGLTGFSPNVVGPARFNAVLTGFASSLIGGTEDFVVDEELNIAVRHGTAYVPVCFKLKIVDIDCEKLITPC